MLFMNDYDIDCAQRIADREEWEVMSEAVGILDRLREWTDQNSDGWAYWRLPVQAAKRLQERIQEQEAKSRDYRAERTDMDRAHLRAALSTIKAFLTKQGVSEQDRLWIIEGKRPAPTIRTVVVELSTAEGAALIRYAERIGEPDPDVAMRRLLAEYLAKEIR